MRKLPRWLAGLALCALLTAGLGSGGQAMAADDTKEKESAALTGDARCTKCHDESEEYPVLSIARTKHGVKADKRMPTCAACHGESPTHVSKPEGVKIRPSSDIGYGPKTKTPIEVQNKTCISCHQGRKMIHWQGSMHDVKEVACTGCHNMHTSHDKVMEKVEQAQVCYTCHKEQRALFNKPSRHPVKEAKVICSDCHGSHGTTGPKLMVRDSIAETCFMCHMEKRGPFVRTHQPAEDCSICHNPHGTAADNLLKTRMPFLCQQCHEPNSHKSGIPSMPRTTPGDPNSVYNITQARSCLNCHTNIHGTNNPRDITGERTFRH